MAYYVSHNMCAICCIELVAVNSTQRDTDTIKNTEHREWVAISNKQ